MNLTTWGLAPLSLVIGLNAWAGRGEFALPQEKLNLAGASQNIEKVDGIYKLPQTVFITPEASIIDGEFYVGERIRLSKGEPFAVKFQDNGDVALQLLLTEEEKGEVAEQIILTRDQYDKLKLEFAGLGGEKELEANYSPYEEYDVAARGGGGGRRARYRRGTGVHSGPPRMVLRDAQGRWKASGCLAFVQDKIGWPDGMGTIGGGAGMVSALLRHKKLGWHSSNCGSPRDGDVASWHKAHTAVYNGARGCWEYDGGRCGDPGGRYGGIKACARRSGW